MASFSILDLDYEPVPLTPEVCSCKCAACIKVDLLKTHYHIRLCTVASLSILVLWLDAVNLRLETLSMSIMSFLKKDIATSLPGKVVHHYNWGFLVYWNNYILNDASVNIQLFSKQWSWGSQALCLVLHEYIWSTKCEEDDRCVGHCWLNIIFYKHL